MLGLIIGAVIAFTGEARLLPPLCSRSAPRRLPRPRGAAASPDATGSAPIITDAANVNCDIIVQANPLSAHGLATPYQLTGRGGMSPARRAAR